YKYLLNDAWESSEYITDDIVFIPREMLEKDNISLLEEVKIESNAISIKATGNEVEDNLNKNMYTVNNTVEDNELKFINRFKEVARTDFKLFYDEKDLYNFHTAMKIGSLVILSGLSGTGKSKLVKAYAKALQLSKEQLNFISVRPFWQDDSDLLGYADTINSIYRAGDSGLIDTLIEAENNKDKLYLVCFDEMNLAKVEHYFSQF
ncbi:ATP-binding protein, partial [Enterococcus hirae]